MEKVSEDKGSGGTGPYLFDRKASRKIWGLFDYLGGLSPETEQAGKYTSYWPGAGAGGEAIEGWVILMKLYRFLRDFFRIILKEQRSIKREMKEREQEFEVLWGK